MANRPSYWEIMREINEAIRKDFDAHPYSGDMMPIPARTHKLMEDAVKRAFAKAEKERK